MDCVYDKMIIYLACKIEEKTKNAHYNSQDPKWLQNPKIWYVQ